MEQKIKGFWGRGPYMTTDWKRSISLLRSALRRTSLPEYWHKNSPKTYKVWQHAVMLVFYRRYFDSYTDFVENLDNTILPELINLKRVPDEGTLCKEEKRLRKYLQLASILIVIAILPKRFVAGGDGTGLQTKKASAYYIKRVLGQFYRRGFARLELVVWKTYILAWELRLLPKDELAMLKSCWKQLRKRPTTLVYDKKGDCEAHHNWLESQGIRSIAPVRKGARRGKYRQKLMKKFPQKTYNKRNRNENVNWMFKNRYGEALNAYTVKGRRAELATKVLAHNLWARLKALLIRTFQYRQFVERFKYMNDITSIWGRIMVNSIERIMGNLSRLASGLLLYSSLFSPQTYADNARPKLEERLIFVSAHEDEKGEIYTLDLKTNDLQRITKDNSLAESDPSTSPDGAKIAFEAGGRVYITEINGKEEPRYLTAGIQPRWSPDGKRITVSTPRGKLTLDIGVINIDGTEFINLTKHLPENYYEPCFSEDGKYIYCTGEVNIMKYPKKDEMKLVMSSRDIYKFRSDRSDADLPEQLTFDGKSHNPECSKNGIIAYISEAENDNAELWIMNNHGNKQKRVTAFYKDTKVEPLPMPFSEVKVVVKKKVTNPSWDSKGETILIQTLQSGPAGEAVKTYKANVDGEVTELETIAKYSVYGTIVRM